MDSACWLLLILVLLQRGSLLKVKMVGMMSALRVNLLRCRL